MERLQINLQKLRFKQFLSKRTMRVKLQITFFFIFLTTIGNLYSQFEPRGDKFNGIDAESFYDIGNYYDALPLYRLLMDQKPDRLAYKMRAGICYLHLNQNPEKAIEYIKNVYDIDPDIINIHYYLGRSYALNYEFKLALEQYDYALTNKNTEPSFIKDIPHLKEQCNNAIGLVKDSLSVEIINLGGPINTSANEYSPIINEEESVLIFTYRGEKSVGGRLNKYNKPKKNGSFNEDIYISNFNNNLWEEPTSISDSINSVLNEGGISISADGNKLFLYKDTKAASGDIYESIKEESEWSEPKRLGINSKYWEGHATVSTDGEKIIFSSNRPGGIGGKDLYSATLKKDGSWGNIKNLGSTINTIYDEDSPFLHADGEMFNFSSKGHSSMGGYDVFESKVIGDSAYSSPVNMGYPINTTSNDIFYRVLANENVYYSSARKGGYGQNDIYFINVTGINITGIAFLYKDPNSPIANLRVNITNKERTFNLADTTDNAGRYNFSKLKIDDEYILFIDEIDEAEIDDSIYVLEGEITKIGRPHIKTLVNNQKADDKGKYRLEIESKYQEETNPLEGLSEDEILEKYGDKKAPGLIYKVQVAALSNVNNFDAKSFKSLGEVEQIVLDDGLTRFMVGGSTTLKEATGLLDTAKSKGKSDAFIIVFVDGKRTYLEELVKNDVFE
ncbi:MAG: hypothetical protein COB15_16035 [Flavobacteriales bacterium]|nr:MAG: hypothetical protein COB15_16035 [Flavobacteriales bacterium]